MPAKDPSAIGIVPFGPGNLLRALEEKLAREYKEKHPAIKGQIPSDVKTAIALEAQKQWEVLATKYSVW